jgi:hypothetical protein
MTIKLEPINRLLQICWAPGDARRDRLNPSMVRCPLVALRDARRAVDYLQGHFRSPEPRHPVPPERSATALART